MGTIVIEKTNEVVSVNTEGLRHYEILGLLDYAKIRYVESMKKTFSTEDVFIKTGNGEIKNETP